MSFYKNVSLYTLDKAACAGPARLDGASAMSKPICPNEMRRVGLVGIVHRNDAELMLKFGGCLHFQLEIQQRVLPASVIKEKFEALVRAYKAANFLRLPGKSVREQLRGEAEAILMPRAFVKTSYLRGYIDTGRALLVIDSGSTNACEEFIGALREGFGEFTAEPIYSPHDVPDLLSRWIINPDKMPEAFTLGSECVLADGIDRGLTVTAKNHELTDDQIVAHLTKGNKKCLALGLVSQNEIEFVLNEKLSIRKIKVPGIIVDKITEAETDELAELIIMTGEFRKLFDAIFEAFDVLV